MSNSILPYRYKYAAMHVLTGVAEGATHRPEEVLGGCVSGLQMKPVSEKIGLVRFICSTFKTMDIILCVSGHSSARIWGRWRADVIGLLLDRFTFTLGSYRFLACFCLFFLLHFFCPLTAFSLSRRFVSDASDYLIVFAWLVMRHVWWWSAVCYRGEGAPFYCWQCLFQYVLWWALQ